MFEGTPGCKKASKVPITIEDVTAQKRRAIKAPAD
jgi:hypothetical protein